MAKSGKMPASVKSGFQAKGKSSSSSSGGSKSAGPKFGSPAWQKKYGNKKG